MCEHVPVAAHLFSICTVGVQARFKIQINSALFIKTLVRKDVASTAETETPAGKDRKSTRLNSSHSGESRMPSSA